MADSLRQYSERGWWWVHRQVSDNRRRLVLWLPALLMVGIIAYFILPEEPRPWLGARFIAVTLALILLTRRWPKIRILLILSVLPLLGFAVSQWRTQTVKTTLLAESVQFKIVEATLEEVLLTEKGARLVLVDPVIETLPQQQTPHRIRLSVRKGYQNLHIGDRVRMTATLYPLPTPALPGGYDFSRHFYYQGIGAVGFGVREPEVIANAEQSRWQEKLQETRQWIAGDMLQQMGQRAGAIAAALAVGEKGAIPESDAEAMRTAGLAHVLAISGLHLGLAAGVVFFWVRLLIVLLPGVPHYVSAKKISAFVALVASLGYLLIAGSPIPAQRSFIMVAFVLIAVMVNRKGISLYSLAWAAAIILLFFPESLLGPSFQMSFAATLAIVGLYERYGYYLHRSDIFWWKRVWYWTVALAATSLVATLATAPFVMYHFNRLPAYSVLTNMAVTPLVSLLIMPSVVLSFVLLPFGGQFVAYWPLQWGIEQMLKAAHWVSAQPFASIPVYSLMPWGVAVAGFGLMWLILLKSRLRWLGVCYLALGVGSAALYHPPDVLISDDGKQVMAKLDDGRYTFLRGTGRAFVAEVWRDALALDEPVDKKETSVQCEGVTCWYEYKGKSIAVLKHSKALPEACAGNPDVLVIWWYVKPYECPGARLLIERDRLERLGAHALRFEEAKIEVEVARPEHVRRAWMK